MISLILTILFSMQLYAQDFLCSGESKRDGLMVKDIKGKTFEIVNFKFEKTPYFESYLNCLQFLEKVQKIRVNDTRFQYLLPLEENVLRVKGISTIVKLCSETPGCRFQFPYSLFSYSYGLKDFFKKSLFASPSLNTCQGDFDKKDIKTNDDFLLAENLQGLSHVWFLPDENFSRLIEEEALRIKPKKIILSSMVISLRILNNLNKLLVDKLKETTVDVYLSFNLHSFEPNFPKLYHFSTGRINIIPVFQRPDRKDSFHIKGIFMENETDQSLMLFSSNIRRFREEKLADLGMTFRNSNIGLAFKNLFNNLKTNSCLHQQYTDCSLAARYGDGDIRKKMIHGWVSAQCSKNEQSLMMNEAPLLRASRVNLYEGVQKEIDLAQQEIILATHVIGESKIISKLISAKKRGVKITLIVAKENSSLSLVRRLKENFGNDLIYGTKGIELHSKFMMIDKKKVFFGSGNFTKTALLNPWEVFLFTSDSQVLDGFRNYLSKFLFNSSL